MTRATQVAIALALGRCAAALPAGGDDAWWITDAGTCECARCEATDDRHPSEFDPATGRSLLHFPPHRLVDHLHMRLEVRIADMDRPRADAVQTLSLVPIAGEVSTLTLDARLLEVASVECAGHATGFTHDGRTLSIEFDPPLQEGHPVEVVTRYSIVDPPFGLTWVLESSAWPNRPAHLHTQGQPETNSYWFPCHDFPNERLTTELIVTVPSGFMVSGNGRLVEHTRRIEGRDESTEDLRTYETFHWLQDKAHVNYLVSMVVGRFDVVDVGTPELQMPVYVPPGRGEDVAATYGRTAAMVALFGEVTGEPYPWDRYAQLVVTNFGAGGMENTSATSMHDTAILSPEALVDHDLDGLISHELAHQWFGDLITCKSWEHIWLNEGFATYFSQLWFEQRDGTDAYFAGIRGCMDGVIGGDKADAPFQAAMCSKQYDGPWDNFRRSANPYSKGASILHMLRARLGDEVFLRGLREYVHRFRLGSPETSDLRQVFEEVSGEPLEQFFDQWCYRPGVPHLDVRIDWSAAARVLEVGVTQTQPIDGYNPAFVFDLPLWIKPADRAGRWAVIPVTGREASATFRMATEPEVVAVDPNLAVLAKVEIEQPEDRFVAQMRAAPTSAARVQGARGLARGSAETSADALAVAAADPAIHESVRIAAIDALAGRKDDRRLLSLAHSGMEDPRVRARLVAACADALARLNADSPGESGEVRGALAEAVAAAASDPAQTVRATAIRGIGRAGLTDQYRLVASAADAESQGDGVRQAALDAIGDLDLAEGIRVAIRYTWPGVYNRTRPDAVRALVKLAHHNPDAAFSALVPLLSDRERRAWEAAGQGLVDLGDERGIAELDRLAGTLRDPRDREKAEEWALALRKKLDEVPAERTE